MSQHRTDWFNPNNNAFLIRQEQIKSSDLIGLSFLYFEEEDDDLLFFDEDDKEETKGTTNISIESESSFKLTLEDIVALVEFDKEIEEIRNSLYTP